MFEGQRAEYEDHLSAERVLLGGCLLGEEPAIEVALAIINREDFLFPSHRLLFDVYHYLYDEQILVDLISVTNALRQRGQLTQFGGVEYLLRLAEAESETVVRQNTEATFVSQLAHIVKANSDKRRQ